MKKSNLNEVKRMQQLAGLLKESQVNEGNNVPYDDATNNRIQAIMDELLETGELIGNEYWVDFDDLGNVWGDIFRISQGHEYDDLNDEDNEIFGELQDDVLATLEHKLFEKYGKKVEIKWEY
jgi:hypothetical protein